MKTLADYIKGYPRVSIELLLRFRSKDNKKYYLCKEPGHNSYYYMCGEEVLEREYISGDLLPKLYLEIENRRLTADTLEKIAEQKSYQKWINFIHKETGEYFKL